MCWQSCATSCFPRRARATRWQWLTVGIKKSDVALSSETPDYASSSETLRGFVGLAGRLCRTDFAPYSAKSLLGLAKYGLPNVSPPILRRGGGVWRRGESNPLAN